MSLELGASGRVGEAVFCAAQSLLPGCLLANFLLLSVCSPPSALLPPGAQCGPLSSSCLSPMPSGLLALNAISMLKTLQFCLSSVLPMSIRFINSTALLGLLRGITHDNSFQLQSFLSQCSSSLSYSSQNPILVSSLTPPI